MSAKNLMAGLTAYTDPDELAASAVAHEQSVVVSITISVITESLITSRITQTVLPD